MKDDLYADDDSDRLIFISDIDENPINVATARLFYLAKKEKSPITVILNTFGGSVYDMLAFYDAMMYVQHVGIDVNTIGLGKIMSAGVLLLAAGTTRKIGRSASVMYHLGSSSAHGNIFEIETELKEFNRLEENVNNLLCMHSRLDLEEIKDLLKPKTDVYMDPEQVIEYGFADSILPAIKKKKLRKRKKKE